MAEPLTADALELLEEQAEVYLALGAHDQRAVGHVVADELAPGVLALLADLRAVRAAAKAVVDRHAVSKCHADCALCGPCPACALRAALGEKDHG